MIVFEVFMGRFLFAAEDTRFREGPVNDKFDADH
jgi:hypothetical protein